VDQVELRSPDPSERCDFSIAATPWYLLDPDRLPPAHAGCLIPGSDSGPPDGSGVQLDRDATPPPAVCPSTACARKRQALRVSWPTRNRMPVNSGANGADEVLSSDRQRSSPRDGVDDTEVV